LLKHADKLMWSYFHACDITVANANYKNFPELI